VGFGFLIVFLGDVPPGCEDPGGVFVLKVERATFGESVAQCFGNFDHLAAGGFGGLGMGFWSGAGEAVVLADVFGKVGAALGGIV
jgi:hypothetical protein